MPSNECLRLYTLEQNLRQSADVLLEGAIPKQWEWDWEGWNQIPKWPLFLEEPWQRFLFRNTMFQNTLGGRHAKGCYLYLPINQNLPSVVSEMLRQWEWGEIVLLGISPDLAGLRKTCYRINVLCDSSLAYLVFARWLVLIKGIWHVQRPLFSSASVCPCVISLFKLCLRLCQVLTVALQEGNRIYLLNRCCTLMDMFWTINWN